MPNPVSSGGMADVNDHHWPWQVAMAIGWAVVICAGIFVLADTLDSGWSIVNLFYIISPQPTQTANIVFILLGFILAAAVFLIAETALFMASGHAETVATARGSKEVHGIRARIATDRRTVRFFRKYRTMISTASMVYMVATDFIGLYVLEWSGMWHASSPELRFLIAAPINLGLAALGFIVALNGFLYGGQMIEYARWERDANLREESQMPGHGVGSGSGASGRGGSGGASGSPQRQPQIPPPRRQVTEELPEQHGPGVSHIPTRRIPGPKAPDPHATTPLQSTTAAQNGKSSSYYDQMGPDAFDF